MTYNLSPKTVARWSQTLDKLDGEEVVFRAANPYKLSYRLREAIAAAIRHGIEPYDKLEYTFVVSGDRVIARPRKGFAKEKLGVTRRFEDVLGEYEIVKLANAASEGVLEFPSYVGGLKSVELWCLSNGFELSTDPYLVLTRKIEEVGDE